MNGFTPEQGLQHLWDNQDKLSSWGKEFTFSVSKQYADNGKLTAKQWEWVGKLVCEIGEKKPVVMDIETCSLSPFTSVDFASVELKMLASLPKDVIDAVYGSVDKAVAAAYGAGDADEAYSEAAMDEGLPIELNVEVVNSPDYTPPAPEPVKARKPVEFALVPGQAVKNLMEAMSEEA